ncbi:enoyl-CoA hydratase-related protein [Trujillonella humicola]|uniref:enoyl-CoA hydratase-related protein n=1 Tax=Trujillonella humicola TaxID=3383699 RepID=UPI003905FBAB
MSAPKVLVERHGHVLVVTINRPEVRNAVDGEVHMTIGRLLDEVDADPDVRVVVITGAGGRAFCAGADLKANARGESVLPRGFEHWGFAGWVRHPIGKPTIAAVNGAAMGGGAELLLSCDLAVAAEHAVIGLPEVTIGMIAADGGPFRALAQLPQRVGMELVLTGDPITAARALDLNLVNRVVPGPQVLDAALALAGRIAANAPLAVQASKRIALGLRGGERPAERLHWELTREHAHATAGSADAREGVRAFLEKRPPVWTGR